MYKMVNGEMTKMDPPPKPTVDGMKALNAKIAELTAALEGKDNRIAELTAALEKKQPK